ncbi:PREDICTED: uncharacterized protein LOC105459120 [Wasmannia auropunctata]|uniref:uncharacterized protein LOC105459120 n=1 Tax=Wasmannia auropunctata TaxID=64793 RepID=UPI0005EF97FE|nr:PREDICTED: uncharacterized protein LOC105459120 [Wasmannia auropunctata]
MSSYSYYYVKTIVEDGRPQKTYKFAKGYPVQATKDAWSTLGRYNLLSRLLRGGLSGSGDVHHPANTTFKESLIRESGSMWCTCKQAPVYWRRVSEIVRAVEKGRDRVNLTGYASQCITYHTLVRVHFGTIACSTKSVSSGVVICDQVFELRPELREKSVNTFVIR